MPDKLPGDVAKEVLLMEQRGELPDYAQRDLDAMREANLAPPALPRGVRPTPEPLTFRQELDVAGRGLGEFATETARTGALPTIGGVAGATLGGALTLPFGGSGALVGESVGSMLGEGANQLFGITDPSLTQIGLAGAGGPVLRGVQRAYRGLRPSIGRRMPGGAPVRHELAQETLENLPAGIRPGPGLEDALWTRVDQLGRGQKVITTNLDNALGRLINREQKVLGTKDTSWINELQALRDAISQPPYSNDVPFARLDATRKKIGLWTKSLDKKTENIGDELYAAIERDYDAFQTLGGRPAQLGGTLDEARRATRDKYIAERIDKIILPGYASGDLGPRVAVGTVTKRLRQDPLLAKHMTPEQWTLIEETLGRVKGLPARPPDKGVNYGSGRNVLSGAGGALLGSFSGDPAVAIGLGSLGMIVPRVIGTIVQSPLGRTRLRAMLQGTGGQIDPRMLVGIYNAVISKRPDVPEGTRVTLGGTR